MDDYVHLNPRRGGRRSRRQDSIYNIIHGELLTGLPSAQTMYSTDSVMGIPYYRHPENSTAAPGIHTRPASQASVPMQISGNMLGARARAAEYNAAKNASARQQASQEADDQKIPAPAPISLGAFTRNASQNKNKGIKTFRPLVLSAEEDQSTDSYETDQRETRTPSPTPIPDIIDPPRAASLPPQSTNISTHAEFVRSIQTPYRYRDIPIVPFAPRAMFPEDGYPFPPQQMSMHPQHYHPYLPVHSLVPPQQLSHHSNPHSGWYVPPEQQQGVHNPHSELRRSNETPITEFRPQLQQKSSSQEEPQPADSPKNASSKDTADSLSLAFALGGSTLHVFGPDDLSPTKIEIKQRARNKETQERIFARPPHMLVAHAEQVRTPEPRKVQLDPELVRTLQSHSQPTMAAHPKPVESIRDLLIDRNIIAAIKPRKNTVAGATLQKLEDAAKEASAARRGDPMSDWSYLDGSVNHHGMDHEDQATPTKPRKLSRVEESVKDHKQILLESLLPKKAEPSEMTVRPPPGLAQPKVQSHQFPELESEQVTDIKFPLVDMKDPCWLEIRRPNEEERDLMRRVFKTVRTESMCDKAKSAWEDRRGLERHELNRWLHVSGKDFQDRRRKINGLADEMQSKWEHGGSFRSATMTAAEAKQHATTVKAVGSIMSTLSMQMDDSSGFHHRGSRPYCAPPEYLIERSTGLDKEGRSHSLFESDGDTTRTAPPRLARDPRFRPQLGDTVKIEEGRIPRMFVARRM